MLGFADLSNCGIDSVDWINLPNELWEHILSFADGLSLMRATETCTKINKIIDENPKLIDKLWLKIYVGDADERTFIEGLKVIRKSKRKYKQLFMHYVKMPWFKNELFLEVLNQLGESVNALATDSVKFASRQELVETLRMFPHLKRLQLKMVVVDEEEPEKQYLNEEVSLPCLADLYLVEYYPWICDILTPCVNIKRLEAYTIKWTENDPIPFENFLFKQTSLEKLRLGIFRQGRLFKDDRSNEIQFQLDNLLLNGAFYANRENILKFVQTQKTLKKFQINLLNEYEKRLDANLFYNEIIKFVFTCLPELTSFAVNQDKFKFPDFEFLRVLPPNNKIENLRIVGESVDIFTALVTSVLPNVKNLSYEANFYPSSVPSSSTISEMTSLETLVLDKFFVDCLKEIHIPNGKLKTFEFVARWISDDFESNFKIFMHRHTSLTRLRIGVIKFLANLFVTMTMCQEIVTNLTQLESLNIQNFEDVNAAVQFLVTEVKSLKLIEVSSEQFKLLTQPTFDDCSFNGVCISVGK